MFCANGIPNIYEWSSEESSSCQGDYVGRRVSSKKHVAHVNVVSELPNKLILYLFRSIHYDIFNSYSISIFANSKAICIAIVYSILFEIDTQFKWTV